MAELFTNLGINWKVLIAQIINFGILLFLLKYFLYGPVMKMLDSRKEKLEQDKKISDSLKARIEEIEKLKEKTLDQARESSQKLIKDTEKLSIALKEKMMNEARIESEKILLRTQKELEGQKVKIKEEVKKEIGAIVISALEKSMGDFIDAGAQAKLSQKATELILSRSAGSGEA